MVKFAIVKYDDRAGTRSTLVRGVTDNRKIEKIFQELLISYRLNCGQRLKIVQTCSYN